MQLRRLREKVVNPYDSQAYALSYKSGGMASHWKDPIFLGLIPDNARSLLDVGGATGNFSDVLQAAGRDVRYVVVDPSEPIVAAGKQLGRDVRPGGLPTLPFADNSFDTVVCKAVFPFDQGDLDKSVRELNRVGKTVIFDIARKSGATGRAIHHPKFGSPFPITLLGDEDYHRFLARIGVTIDLGIFIPSKAAGFPDQGEYTPINVVRIPELSKEEMLALVCAIPEVTQNSVKLYLWNLVSNYPVDSYHGTLLGDIFVKDSQFEQASAVFYKTMVDCPDPQQLPALVEKLQHAIDKLKGVDMKMATVIAQKANDFLAAKGL